MADDDTTSRPRQVGRVFRPGVQMNAIITSTEQETSDAGESLARTLRAGDVVLLYGELGAGKTAFVRGLARGIGANPDDVSSPTFTIVQEYAGETATLYHVDLYRLEPAEIDDLGLEDLVSGDGIVAIEWAERWRDRPSDAIEVTLTDIGDERRRIALSMPNAECRMPNAE
jgi:tRNA threonylcarbamoyladenosine biosynthesis protein TsaE